MYLFIHSNGGYVDSIVHPFDLLPASVFGDVGLPPRGAPGATFYMAKKEAVALGI
jgi:hypothetical protein